MSKLQHIEETVNTITGEISVIRKTFSVKSKTTEEFYFTFLTGLNAICELSRPSDMKILSILCARAEFNTGKVKLTPQSRKEIVDKLKISPQSFTNSVSRLKEVHLLSGAHGEYEINPQHFWKGTTDERNRLLKDKKVTVNYDFDANG